MACFFAKLQVQQESHILFPMPKSSRRDAKARLLSSRTVYRGPVFWVTTDQVLEPGGVRVRRDIVRHSGSVVILAVDESGAEALTKAKTN
jgi:ADP-ribose pyrophosphatase